MSLKGKRLLSPIRYTTDSLAVEIAGCERCPRLLDHCRTVAKEKRKAYANWTYWGKPVPNFGRLPARLLIVGLAPAAHGANRTSRMFTGDRSGEWLYRALHKAGFAKTTGYLEADDNELVDTAITSIAHCAPPDNKPTTQEISNCRPFLEKTLLLAQPVVILCLGGLAWRETLTEMKNLGFETRSADFAHGIKTELNRITEGAPRPWSRVSVYASYHPSQQNTFTKRLTEPMFDSVFAGIREELDRS